MNAAICPACKNPIESGKDCPVCLLQLGLGKGGLSSPDSRHQAPMPTIDELAPWFPQLEFTRMIGRGGMGAIYQARQTSLGRDVAVKLIAREYSDDPQFVERFEREARALALLSHPNIVTVYDFGRTADGQAYLIMELVNGVNLREAISARRVGPHEAIDLIEKMARALDYAHAKGVVHRDIKPENVLLGDDDTLKIADFGIAKVINDPKKYFTLTATRQVLGSPHYLAPEQIESPDQVDHRIDLYALGVIFYELLTGQLPLGVFEPPSTAAPEVDKRIDPVVLKLLHRNPTYRYQSARELLADLNWLKSNVGPASPGGAFASQNQVRAVPFSMDTFGGFAELKGMLQASGGGLRIEYMIVDGIVGSVKTAVSVIDIPRERVLKVGISEGVFGPKIHIVTDDIAAVRSMPDGESGTLKAKVKRENRDLAYQFVRALGFDPNSDTSSGQDGSRNYQPTLALLLMGCALLNSGFMATSIVAVNSTPWMKESPIPYIAISFVYGLLILSQLVGGLIHLISGLQTPMRVAQLTSLLPITPVAILSIPIVVWNWLTDRSQATRGAMIGAGSSSSANWTATTLVYLRENRTARTISILNALGVLVAVCGLAIYYTGWYPVQSQFRMVPLPVDGIATEIDLNNPDGYTSTLETIQKRLNGLPDCLAANFPDNNHVTIESWKRHQPRVVQRLAVSQAPFLAFVIPAGTGDDDRQAHATYDVAAGLDVTGAKVNGAGMKVTCRPPKFTLDEKKIRSITDNSGSSLVVQWSTLGREKFDQFVKQDSQVGSPLIALVVDGVVQGVTSLTGQSNQRLDFTLAKGSISRSEAITSAIRGPDLPVEFELLGQ